MLLVKWRFNLKIGQLLHGVVCLDAVDVTVAKDLASIGQDRSDLGCLHCEPARFLSKWFAVLVRAVTTIGLTTKKNRTSSKFSMGILLIICSRSRRYYPRKYSMSTPP